jgi:hypothetical protein
METVSNSSRPFVSFALALIDKLMAPLLTANAAASLWHSASSVSDSSNGHRNSTDDIADDQQNTLQTDAQKIFHAHLYLLTALLKKEPALRAKAHRRGFFDVCMRVVDAHQESTNHQQHLHQAHVGSLPLQARVR